jgi:hypothetical protein
LSALFINVEIKRLSYLTNHDIELKIFINPFM